MYEDFKNTEERLQALKEFTIKNLEVVDYLEKQPHDSANNSALANLEVFAYDIANLFNFELDQEK